MSKDTVTDAYIMGIQEAREIKRELEANGIDLNASQIEHLIATEKELCALFAGTELAGLYRGSRDFWKLQLKKLNSKGA